VRFRFETTSRSASAKLSKILYYLLDNVLLSMLSEMEEQRQGKTVRLRPQSQIGTRIELDSGRMEPLISSSSFRFP
jgi:hypothetical protein